LKTIDETAFSGTAVQSIDLPRSVEFIGNSCFFGCHSLKSFTTESNSQLKTISSGAFLGIHLEMLSLPDIVDIHPEAFSWDLVWPLFKSLRSSRGFELLDGVIFYDHKLVFHFVSRLESFLVSPEIEVIWQFSFA
jgi:hypothetical protein